MQRLLGELALVVSDVQSNLYKGVPGTGNSILIWPGYTYTSLLRSKGFVGSYHVLTVCI